MPRNNPKATARRLMDNHGPLIAPQIAEDRAQAHPEGSPSGEHWKAVLGEMRGMLKASGRSSPSGSRRRYRQAKRERLRAVAEAS